MNECVCVYDIICLKKNLRVVELKILKKTKNKNLEKILKQVYTPLIINNKKSEKNKENSKKIRAFSEKF